MTVIVGGGPTAVELAVAVAEVARRTLARNIRLMDPDTEQPSGVPSPDLRGAAGG